MNSRPAITYRDLAGRSILEIKGVGDRRSEALDEMGVHSVLDLLTFYPFRWVDRTNEAHIRDVTVGAEALVLGTVEAVSSRTTRNRLSIVTVRLSDGTGRLTLTFFRQSWRAQQLARGREIAAFGRVEEYRGALQMSNPVVDLVGREGGRTGRIVPVYRQSEKHRVHSWDISGWVENALARCEERGILDPVPQGTRDQLDLDDRHRALIEIHQPSSLEARDRARRRLAFDEVFRIQMMLVARKRAIERDSRAFTHRTEGPLLVRFLDGLPFALTAAQRRVIGEIAADLAAPRPMSRLLQGDVGSGKTLVALWTMLAAVESGHQAAMMAPTEVLAEQHFAGISKLLSNLTVPDDANLFGDRGVRVEILTNRISGEKRRAVLAGLAEGEVDIVVGTHALIQDNVAFRDLSVVVVDEQHRFGVEQRAALRERAAPEDGAPIPDLLSMTATPIPRTAAMTVYGDLDVSVIDEMPPGRTPIVTTWVGRDLFVDEMWGEVRERLDRGEQAYVVCPLIEESDKLEVASAEKTLAELEKNELAGYELGLLHGRMSSSEKDSVMNRFRLGTVQVLVSTTVIEVGVDVPNATAMVVLDADRFGIAQLHQLRGRVGRGDKASMCWLVTDGERPSPRVAALVASTDGFELAEVDLALRGEGTVLGESQSGRSGLKLASLARDLDLIGAARTAAFALVDADPELSTMPELRDELELMFTVDEEEFLFKG